MGGDALLIIKIVDSCKDHGHTLTRGLAYEA